jgi:hypothetical protein
VAGWEQAADHVKHNHPAHAALEPALIERLATWSRRRKAAARGYSRPAATWGFQTQGGLQLPQVRRVTRPARRTSWPLGWLLLVAIMGLLRSTSGWITSQAPDKRFSPPLIFPVEQLKLKTTGIASPSRPTDLLPLRDIFRPRPGDVKTPMVDDFPLHSEVDDILRSSGKAPKSSPSLPNRRGPP